MTSRDPRAPAALERDDSLARGHEWWGLVFGLAALVALLGSFVVSWFYLRFAAPAWPLSAEPLPLGLPVLATALALASVPLAALCGWSAPRGRAGLLAATAGGLALVALALVAVLGAEIARADLRATADARASLFYVLHGFVVALAAVGLMFAVGVAIRARRGDFTPRRHVAVQMLTIWWYFVVVAWLSVFATLYLAERILGGG